MIRAHNVPACSFNKTLMRVRRFKRRKRNDSIVTSRLYRRTAIFAVWVISNILLMDRFSEINPHVMLFVCICSKGGREPKEATAISEKIRRWHIIMMYTKSITSRFKLVIGVYLSIIRSRPDSKTTDESSRRNYGVLE